MGITLLKMGGPSALLPDERVALEQRSFRAVSSTTLPSYRIGFSLPPLWRISLLITDSRCIVVTDLFHCMTQEVGMWYPGRNPEDDPETITGVRATSGIFGRCLEIRTHNPKRRQRWLWSPDMTLRFFLSDPGSLKAVIAQQMAQSGSGNGRPEAIR